MVLLVLAMADLATGAADYRLRQVPIAPALAATASALPQPVGMPAAAPVPTTQPAANPPVAADAAQAPAPQAEPRAVAPPEATGTDTPAAAVAASGDGFAAPRDPWIKVNRSIWKFDTALERNLLAPVAHGYDHVVPRGIRFHITSALFNIEEPLTAANDLLQLRFGSMSKAVLRFVINTTIGIGGLFDVANASGIPPHVSDFGQTLGRYGVKAGPYVMLPFFGPSNVRDGFGRLVDNFIDPAYFFIGGIISPQTISLFVVNGIDWRSRSDDTVKAVYGATDPYAFARSAFSQQRAAAVLRATGKEASLPDFDAVPGTP